MWVRGILGIVFCVAGVVWIAQGVGVLKGSGMSGHGGFGVLGAAAFIVGAALLLWAARVRHDAGKPLTQ